MASALRIAASATAFGKEQCYCQRYEPIRRRYLANVEVDDAPEGDADEEGDEGDADADNDDADEEVLYAGPPENFRGRGWRRGRSRYGSRFGRRGFGPGQASAYPPGAAQQGAYLRLNVHGPPPSAQSTSSSAAPPYEQQQQAPRVSPEPDATFAMSSGIFPRYARIQIGEGHVSMSRTDGSNVRHTMVLVTLAIYLR